LSRQALLPSAEASQLLPTPEGPADQKIGVVVDPSAFAQHREQAAVEAARDAIVDVFDAGLMAQLGVLQPLREPLVAS
jgi:hypothetical protein